MKFLFLDRINARRQSPRRFKMTGALQLVVNVHSDGSASFDMMRKYTNSSGRQIHEHLGVDLPESEIIKLRKALAKPEPDVVTRPIQVYGGRRG